MGVPIDVHPTPGQTTPSEVGDVVLEADSAKALSGGKGASSPGGSPRDIVSEYFEALKGSTKHDAAKAASLLVELNKSGQMDKISQITESLSARPIVNRLTYMLASESKLATNTLTVIHAVCRGLRIIRENGGYGDLNVKVKDGMALHLKTTVDDQIGQT